MTEFIKIHNPYIEKDQLISLINTAENNNYYSKSGGNSKCAIIDDFAVLKTGNIKGNNDEFDNVISTLETLQSQGINVVKVLGYVTTELGTTFGITNERYDKGYIIQDKAVGTEWFDRKQIPFYSKDDPLLTQKIKSVLDFCKKINSIPQEHIDKYLSDYKEISEKIKIDPSKLTNFFYDNQKGFSFIDLNFAQTESLFNAPDLLGNNSHRHFLQHSFAIVPHIPLNYVGSKENIYSPEEIEFIKSSIIGLFQKLCLAAYKIGITKEDFQSFFTEQNTPTSSSSAFSLFEYESFDEIINLPIQSLQL